MTGANIDSVQNAALILVIIF